MIERPCLACGSENDLPATACGRCGRALTAWAERPPIATPHGALRQLPSRPALLGIVLAIAVAIAFGPMALTALTRRGQEPRGPTWRDPASIAAWAGTELQAGGATPLTVEARHEKRTLAPRRLVVTGHPTGQALLDVIRATGRLLVAARARGEATATHLAIVHHGTRVLLLPIGDAARVAKSDEAAAAWLDEQERLRRAAAAGTDASGQADGLPVLGPEWPPPISSGIFVGPPVQPSIDGLPVGQGAPTQPASTPAPAVPAMAALRADPGPAPSLRPPSPPVKPAAAPEKPDPAAGPAPPVRVLKTSAGGPLPSRVTPAQEGVVLLRVQVHPGTRRALRLEAVSVRARGTLADVEDISFVDLVRDVDRDGKRGRSDVALGGRQSFADDDGTLVFEGLGILFGEDGAGVELIVTADLADESLGGTLLLALQDPSAVSVTEVSSGARCGVRGVPLTGPVISIDANIEEDPEQARLDALAEAGPDAIDENLTAPASQAENPDAAGASGASGASGPNPQAPSPITPISPFPRRR